MKNFIYLRNSLGQVYIKCLDCGHEDFSYHALLANFCMKCNKVFNRYDEKKPPTLRSVRKLYDVKKEG